MGVNILNGTVTLLLSDYIALKKDSEDLVKLTKGMDKETVPVIYHEWQYMGTKNAELVILSKDETLIQLFDRIRDLNKEIDSLWNQLHAKPDINPKKWYQIWK